MKIYGTVTFPVVSYECETWFLTLRKEHTLRVFGKRVLMGERRRIHNEKL